MHASRCRRSGGRGGVRRRTPPPTRRQQHINRYQLQSTYDSSDVTVSPFIDIMINRLHTAPTNPSTTRLSIAQPAVKFQPSLCRRLNHQPHVSIFRCTYYHHHCSHNQYGSPAQSPSMDVCDQSSDPGPSGFVGVLSMTYVPPPLDPATLRASRTTQYADPYAAVRVSLATSTTAPPSDEPYTGYR
ncbi:hypothetical protein M405DRAFT_831963 [Rhizopogon salebrosus TDB-379]|nr:hypothetical protein M405DRAFT_831963 [Rhizopogon salebrosus TDB-379]